jgi:hypothetical protein
MARWRARSCSWFVAGAIVVLAGCSASDGDESIAPDVAPSVYASGVRIASLRLYQGVEVSLMEGGNASTVDFPIVAGRDALVRIFVSLDASYDGEPVTARLHLGEGTSFDATMALVGPSSQESLSSTINIRIPGDALQPGAELMVELLQAQGNGSSDAVRFPAQGSLPIVVAPLAPELKIRLLPLAYTADGSGRLPDVSEQQLERYRQRFYATYPVARISLEVAAPLTLTDDLSGVGDGWDSALDALFDYRRTNAVPDDTYLYGLVAPAESANAYCGGDCTLGLSYLTREGDAALRVGLGVGFSDETSVETALHELGHLHGRDHAPCSAGDVDAGFPHADGSIGRWGYDLISDALRPPEQHRDFMGYCAPTWVSDYTYAGLYSRMWALSGVQARRTTLHRYAVLRVGIDGRLSERSEIVLPQRQGAPELVRGQLDGQQVALEGHFHRHSHLPGGLLLLDRGEAGP